MADPREEPVVDQAQHVQADLPDRALLVAGLVVVLVLLICVLMFLVAS
jgi:hypothetical protein